MRALRLPELSAFWLRTSQPAGQPSMPCRVGVVGMVAVALYWLPISDVMECVAGVSVIVVG